MGSQKATKVRTEGGKVRKVRSNEAPIYKLTVAQELLRTHIQELGLKAEVEVMFHPDRKWRFDLFLPDVRIGIEIDGGMWSIGHRKHAAIELDHEKSNAATMIGIRVLRFTNRQVLTGQARQFFLENL